MTAVVPSAVASAGRHRLTVFLLFRRLARGVRFRSKVDGCLLCLIAMHPYRYSFTFRKRKAFVTTETELKLMAAAAIIGLNSRPKRGYNTPAAIGTPSAL